MSKDNVIGLKKPEPFIDDPITTIIRQVVVGNFTVLDKKPQIETRQFRGAAQNTLIYIIQ